MIRSIKQYAESFIRFAHYFNLIRFVEREFQKFVEREFQRFVEREFHIILKKAIYIIIENIGEFLGEFHIITIKEYIPANSR